MPAATAALQARETQRRTRGHRFYAPQAEQKKVPALGATRETPEADRLVVLHYFTGAFDLWVTEMDTETGEAFGLVSLDGGATREWGPVSLPELEAIRPRGTFARTGASEGVTAVGTLRWVVERDCWWTPVKVADLKR